MVNTILTPRVNLRQWLKTLQYTLWDKARAHALLIILCIIFFITAFVLNHSMNRQLATSAAPYLELVFMVILPISLAISVIAKFIYMLFVERPDRLTKAIIDFYKPYLTDANRYANCFIVIFCMLFSFIAFADTKPLIPLMNDYSWDQSFMRLDRLLHFGQDPWRLLSSAFGHPIITQWINYLYNFWYFIMFMFWVGAATSKKTHIQHQNSNDWERQFLLSFIICWIIGGLILATLFSSMGPAFYDLIDKVNNPYAAQMAALANVHETHELWAVDTHAILRESYLNPKPGQLSGISAMPSIHNATSAIFMLTAYRINKKFGHLMAIYLGFIVIGSIHLAWHYAVDAYAGIIIALFVWWLTGKALKLQDKIIPFSAHPNPTDPIKFF